MKGFRFGNKIEYLVLDKLGSEWEGIVYAVYSSRKELKAAKITTLSEETVRICSSWSIGDLDLRRNYPFRPVSTIDWYKRASNELKDEVLCALKRLKKQHLLHSQIQKLKVSDLIPAHTDYGLVLFPSANNHELIPATYEILPLILGETLKSLLDSLISMNLMNSFLNTGRIQSGLNAKDSFRKLADMVVNRLANGVECLYKAGYSVVEPDLHPANLLFGSMNGGKNQIYLIDNIISDDACGCDKDELIHEIRCLGNRICEWPEKGVLLSAYFDGLIEDEII